MLAWLGSSDVADRATQQKRSDRLQGWRCSRGPGALQPRLAPGLLRPDRVQVGDDQGAELEELEERLEQVGECAPDLETVYVLGPDLPGFPALARAASNFRIASGINSLSVFASTRMALTAKNRSHRVLDGCAGPVVDVAQLAASYGLGGGPAGFRDAVGSRYGTTLPAEGHLFDLLEPKDVEPS